MTGLLPIALLVLSRPAYTWHDIFQNNFQDAEFYAHALKGNQHELQKINKEFATSYRFMSAKAHAEMKEPLMMRLEATVEDTNLLYVINGSRRMYRIPKNGLSLRENLADAPGKRQTTLDFGFLTPALFTHLFDAKFNRVDRETGDLVFDLTYKSPPFHDTTLHRVWVNPEKKYITKRVWFAQDGHEMATFIYDHPVHENGVWLPTRAIVKNVEDKVAGITEYTNMKINEGIPSSRFSF